MSVDIGTGLFRSTLSRKICAERTTRACVQPRAVNTLESSVKAIIFDYKTSDREASDGDVGKKRSSSSSRRRSQNTNTRAEP
jgi:hypothetical protein